MASSSLHTYVHIYETMSNLNLKSYRSKDFLRSLSLTHRQGLNDKFYLLPAKGSKTMIYSHEKIQSKVRYTTYVRVLSTLETIEGVCTLTLIL